MRGAPRSIPSRCTRESRRAKMRAKVPVEPASLATSGRRRPRGGRAVQDSPGVGPSPAASRPSSSTRSSRLLDVVDQSDYLERLAGETRIQYFEFASGQSTTVARRLGVVHFGFAASPDPHGLDTRVDASINVLSRNPAQLADRVADQAPALRAGGQGRQRAEPSPHLQLGICSICVPATHRVWPASCTAVDAAASAPPRRLA